MFMWLTFLSMAVYAFSDSAKREAYSCNCGWANGIKSNVKIVGGTFSEENEYPFITGLARKNKRGGYSFFCGGSIISQNHVITVAHCTDGFVKNKTPLYVQLGAHDRSKPNRNAVIIRVSRIAQPSYNAATMMNDIALLTLRRSINFNSVVGPVCMPLPGFDVAGQTLEILGWGAERFQGKMTSRPKKLVTTHLSAASCASAWPQVVKRTNPTHICTLSKRESACQGDSGGPVVWRDPQTYRYTLVGLVSFGDSCTDSRPTVHTKVEPYLRWIQSQISRSRRASICRRV